MDRFIVFNPVQSQVGEKDLKSNMDRFIAFSTSDTSVELLILKSNMDRFIVPQYQKYLNYDDF